MAPTNVSLENDIAALNEARQQEVEHAEVDKLHSNISDLSAKIAAAFLSEKNKNSATGASPNSTFGAILSQLTKFVTLSPKSAEAESQLAQNRKILEMLQNNYYRLLRDENSPMSAHQQRVMSDVAKKIASWVEAITLEADRKLVENRTLRIIVEDAAVEVEAQAILDKPDKPVKPESRKSILRSPSEFTSSGNDGDRDVPLSTSSEKPLTKVEDAYAWASWMVDAMATAEEWRTWIQKTVQETKSMKSAGKPPSLASWTHWKNDVADQAIKLIRRKKEIQETAPSWAKECCETMVARDFALNTVTTGCRIPSRFMGFESESPKKNVSNVAKPTSPKLNISGQNETVKRYSGPNLAHSAHAPSQPSVPHLSRQNFVASVNNALPLATKPSARQTLVGVSDVTARRSRQNIAASPQQASSLASRQPVQATKPPVVPASSQRQNLSASVTSRNLSPTTARQSLITRTRNTSPPTKVLPRLNAPKLSVPAPPKAKKAEASFTAPATKLTVRPKDTERRSIYATEYTKRPNVPKNPKPPAAPKVNQGSSFCLEPAAKVRRPRSPYSVPQGPGPMPGKGQKGGAQAPRKTSPQRDTEVKTVAKGRGMGEKGVASRIEALKVSMKPKQEAVAPVAKKRLHKY